MPDGLIIRDVAQMSPEEIEEECRKLEDAYADALRDNAGFDALTNVWKRIQELQRQMSGVNFTSGRKHPDNPPATSKVI